MNDRSHRNRILAGSVGLLALLGGVALIVGRPAANKPTLTPTAISAADANRAASETASAPPTVHYLWPTFTPTRTPSWQPSSTPLIRTPAPSSTPGPYPADNRIWYQDESVTIYTRDNHLCLSREDQSPIYLAEAAGMREFHANLMLSPDGTMVAFVKPMPLGDGTLYDELWVVNVNGTNPRQLFAAEQDVPALLDDVQHRRIIDLDWIPYSHLLALTTADISGPAIIYNNDLYIIDADQNTHRVLLPPGEGGGRFVISPDGQEIVIAYADYSFEDGVMPPQTISFINTEGGSHHRNVFTFGPIYTYSEWLAFVVPVWTPDASGVWIAIPPADPEYAGDSRMTAWYIPANGSPAIPLMAWDPVRIMWGGSVPVFSPDGRYVAFTGWVESDQQIGLYMLSIDGSQDILYQEGKTCFVRWEPDSQHFIFGIGDDCWEQDSWRRGVIGGGYEPLVEPEVPEQGCAPGS